MDNPMGQVKSFYSRLKKHLTDEYMDLSDKKDRYEEELTQLKIELEQKDRALFPKMEKKDMRKYFSPLNITEVEEKNDDDKKYEMNQNINRVRRHIDSIENSMNEIMDFLKEMEVIQQETLALYENND